VPTNEDQNWKQVVRDATGKAIAVREVPLPQNTSGVRQAVEGFSQFVLENNGDLRTSIEAELKSVANTLTELLNRLNSSRDTNEITGLRGPVGIAVALKHYLEGRVFELNWTAILQPMTVGEFTARALEQEASKMPASMKDQADSLRRAAEIEREFGSSKMIRVWEESQKSVQ
jgi:hypothetical protein